MVIIGLAGNCFLAFLVITVFGVGYSDVSDVGDVISAALAMLAVSAVVEFAVVIPLSRLWNLDFEAEPGSRSTCCPRCQTKLERCIDGDNQVTEVAGQPIQRAGQRVDGGRVALATMPTWGRPSAA